MEIVLISVIAMISRIILLGAERIFLKKLERYDSVVIAGLFFLIAAVFLTPVFFVVKNLSWELFVRGYPALISSLLYAVGFFFYVRAIALEDTSLIAPLYNSSLLWLMMFGFVFLGENVTIFRIIGAISIFLGMFILYPGSISQKLQAIRGSQGSIYMIIGSVFLAIGRTIDAYSIRSVDPRFYAFLINLYVGVYLLIYSLLQGKFTIIVESFQFDWKNLIYAGITNGWSYLFLLIAIQGLELTVAEPLSLLSIFVTAFLGKRIFGENVSHRIPGMVIIVVGAFLLFL